MFVLELARRLTANASSLTGGGVSSDIARGAQVIASLLDRGEDLPGRLAELDRTEFKTNCPHGRPVHIQFARGQIERMFRR